MKTPLRYSAGFSLYECTETGFEICPHKQYLPVKILPEFRDLIAPLSADERDTLNESLKTEGVRDPVVVGWIGKKEYVLLDGHNRFEIERRQDGLEHGIPAAYKIVEFPNREAAKLWILENQVSRRNLTDDQRAIIWNEIRERRSKVIRAVQLANARRVSVKTPKTPAIEKIAPVDTRKAVAAQAKISERKLRAAQEVKTASPELATQVRAGLLTLKQAKAEIAKVAPAPPQKVLDSDGRYRKLHSFVGNLYQEVPATDRPAEIQKHAQQILEDYC